MPFFCVDGTTRPILTSMSGERAVPPDAGRLRRRGRVHPAATRPAAGRLAAPVLVYAGELDANATPETAATGACLFPNTTVTVQPGAAHFAWIGEPTFTAAICAAE
jgi:pimeloyl-ACP methyl ester carboxylesterase